jgi:adenylate kinase family enzyme
MIFNIRGTSGSGKTHLVRQIVKHYKHRVITDADDHIFGYQLPNNLWVLGRYDDAIKGGGVDNITGRLFKRYQTGGGDGNSMDAVDMQVRRWAERGRHVIFEGLIVTSVWGRWLEMAKDLEMMFLFLDTPMETCYERVLERSGGRTPKGYPGDSDLEKKHAAEQKRISSIERRQTEVNRQMSSLEDFHKRQADRHIPKAEAADLLYEIVDHKNAFDQVIRILETTIDR